MLNEQLEVMCRKAGLTNKQVANLCGVSEPTISRLFSGETKDPPYSAVAAIVKACGGSLDELEGITRQAEKTDIGALKSAYEASAAQMEKLYNQQIAELKESYNKHQEENEMYERLHNRRLYFVLGITAALIVILDILGDVVAKMV